MRNLMLPLLAGITAFISINMARADLGDQLFKLLADDGAGGDRFGYSVAVSGSFAIVGAYRNDNNGNDSGSAYLFDTNTGQQVAQLLPKDGETGDQFGWNVEISGTTAIIGAISDDDNGDNSGSAYLFDITTGQQLFKLLPNDGAAGDWFGVAVAIYNTTAIVGAWLDDDNGDDSGSAYLFDTTTGKQLFKLLPNDGEKLDGFGFQVAISGTTAIIGVSGDDDNGQNSGSAYLFDITTGQQIAKLLPDDGSAVDNFGASVALGDLPDGEVALVGANGADGQVANSGSAYLFNINSGKQIAKLLPSDGAALDWFGISVAISGDTAIIGANRDTENGLESGSAYLFDITTGKQIAKLLAIDGTAEDWFGWSVGIGGTPGNETAIVGTWHIFDNGEETGSAYIFDAASVFDCSWDLHGDGIVGPGDLLILLGWWGFDPDGPPDFDGDGIVGTSDLLELLAHWGPCE